MANFHFSYPGLRVIPETFYHTSLAPQHYIGKGKKGAIFTAKASRKTVSTKKMQFTLTDADSGKPIPDVRVVAFTDFKNEVGDEGFTAAQGKVTLALDAKKIERLYVYPDHSYWGAYRFNVAITESLELKLAPIDTEYTDVLRHFAGRRIGTKIKNTLRIGVIDTGVGPHSDVPVTGGMNMIKGEKPQQHTDNGEGHGTHVAGIIAAFGKVKGVAGGAEIFSYRVFPKLVKGEDQGASNFDIMKAIDRAVQDKCDLINMSLGGSSYDEAVISSIKSAFDAGVLCFAATGNENRSPVGFPASYSLSIAVAAMGRKGTFPAGTVQTSIVSKPVGTDKDNFVADFSNVGPETDLTAPGVGIISTYPKNRYAIMDGTSMACPAATGMAARLLSANPTILKMPRDQNRSVAMMKFLSTKTKILGFGHTFEGKGMLE